MRKLFSKNYRRRLCKIVLAVCVLFAVAMLLAEGLIFYRDYENKWIRLSAAVHNAMRSFILDPVISIPEVADQLREETNVW